MNALNGCIAGLADRQSSGEVATGRIGSNYDSNSQSTGGTYTCKSVPFAGRTSVLKSEETISKLPINSAAMHPRHIPAIVKERRPHEVSQEVMLYFCELTEACVGASESRRHEALENAAVDTGLQPILPHLVIFITEGVSY
ncbi:unnamed protein product [Protopolystoma xenopodis]|uniref:TAF6 C-terminal HEAT repeat domain-containing protein n=1 Tax=Protopolystoma xenopodis TaxID=117903 RepID=A0A448WRH0_9PLAT|nr:unnamed protein product [Protopolystoma xenopodis]